MTKIGLKRGTVKLVKYNPKWGELFKLEEIRLRKNLKENIEDIQHIGSTAIPDLSAKPAIDIMVGIKSMKKARHMVWLIENLGYKWRSKWGRLDRHIVFGKGDIKTSTHYLHLVTFKGKIWNDRLLFRDYLRKDKKYLKEYEKLKLKLANKFGDNRKIYTANKNDFVINVLRLARKK